jgi:hypothetical protein
MLAADLRDLFRVGRDEPCAAGTGRDRGAAQPMTSAEYGKLIAEETEKWGKVVKFAGVSVD